MSYWVRWSRTCKRDPSMQQHDAKGSLVQSRDDMIKRKQAITTEDPQRCYDYRHSGSARVCIVTTKSAFVIFSCFFIHCFTVLVCLRSYRFLLDRALPARR
jgi:hypothetical protein